MKRAFVVMGLVACSSAPPAATRETMPVPSEDHELMTIRPRQSQPSIEIDPEIEILRGDERLEAPPPPPVATCLPPSAGARFTLEAHAIRACWNRGGDFSAAPDTCLWIGKDGSAWTGDAPAATAPRGPSVTIGGDARTVEVCLAEGACRTIAPELTAGRLVQQAVLDEDGARVALLLHDGATGDGTVDLFDARTGERLASGTRARKRHTEVRYAIAFFGPGLLWVQYDKDDEAAKAELWKTKRSKLKRRKKLRGLAGEWSSLGDGRFVVTDERSQAQVWDARKAKRIAKVEIRELADVATAESPSMLVTGPGGGFSLVALAGERGRVAFVDGTERRPRPAVVDIPMCQ